MTGASCFAGKLRVLPVPGQSHPWPGDGSTLVPTHATGVPVTSRNDCSRSFMPLVGPVGRGLAADWPPSGEWSGRAERCASRD